MKRNLQPATFTFGYDGMLLVRFGAEKMSRVTHSMQDGSPKNSGTASKSDFFDRVWDVVAQIPHGRVTTYGQIAEYLGPRSAARTVGWAMNAAAGLPLPCHRVVNRFGALSGKRHFEGPDVMEERLRSEGVAFTDDGCVDLEKHLWIPSEELTP